MSSYVRIGNHDIYADTENYYRFRIKPSISDIEQALNNLPADYNGGEFVGTVDLADRRSTEFDRCLERTPEMEGRINFLVRTGYDSPNQIVFESPDFMPKETNKKTKKINKDQDGKSVISEAYSGELYPEEAHNNYSAFHDDKGDFDMKGYKAAEKFWENHVLVYPISSIDWQKSIECAEEWDYELDDCLIDPEIKVAGLNDLGHSSVKREIDGRTCFEFDRSGVYFLYDKDAEAFVKASVNGKEIGTQKTGEAGNKYIELSEEDKQAIFDQINKEEGRFIEPSINIFVPETSKEDVMKALVEGLGYKDFIQKTPHHYRTIIDHTLAVYEACDILNERLEFDISREELRKLKTAAIFHDMGKFETAAINPKTGDMQFLEHAAKSVEIMDDHLDYESIDDYNYVKGLVKLHDTTYSKQGKCQAMLNEHPDGFAKDLILFRYADILGQSEYQRDTKLEQLETFAKRLQEVGTPEQTAGLDRVIKGIQKDRERIKEQDIEHTDDINHTSENDPDVKLKSLSELKYTEPNLGFFSCEGINKYSKNGVYLIYAQYLEQFLAAKIDGKDIGTPIHGNINRFKCDYVELSPDDTKIILDKINEAENRTKEPYKEKAFADMSGDERIEKALKNHEDNVKDSQSKDEPTKTDRSDSNSDPTNR